MYFIVFIFGSFVLITMITLYDKLYKKVPIKHMTDNFKDKYIDLLD